MAIDRWIIFFKGFSNLNSANYGLRFITSFRFGIAYYIDLPEKVSRWFDLLAKKSRLAAFFADSWGRSVGLDETNQASCSNLH